MYRTSHVQQWPTLIVGPTQEPVCPTWLADELRLTDSGEAANLVSPARQQVEKDTRRALLTQTWELRQTTWTNPIRLHFPPVQSVEKIEYTDRAGDPQTLDPALYYLDLSSVPGYVWLKSGASWPGLWTVAPSVVVTMVCGYPDPETMDAADGNIKYAIRDAAAQTLFPQECKWQQSYHRLIGLLQWGDYP